MLPRKVTGFAEKSSSPLNTSPLFSFEFLKLIYLYDGGGDTKNDDARSPEASKEDKNGKKDCNEGS